jgi:hypothetical protein
MRFVLASCLVAVLAPAGVAAADETAAVMARIVDPLTRVLPRSLEQADFEDPAHREAIAADLAELAEAAALLEKHDSQRDTGFRYLSGSLADDARDTSRRYERGEYAESRHALHQLTNTCIVCHSRLPSEGESGLGDVLFARAEIAKLSVRQRARLQIATRRFDAALTSYEMLFADPLVSPTNFDMGGDLLDYLTICLRVRRDMERPRATLERLGGRPDLPAYMRRNLSAWLLAFGGLSKELEKPPRVERARELIVDGNRVRGYAADRSGIVYDLVASSILHRYLDANPEPGVEVAEALYLVGITDAWTQRSYWVSEAEFALKAAIRMAPKEPVARDAYALLEEYVVLGYSGSGGVQIPPDVQAELEALRQLIEGEDVTL